MPSSRTLTATKAKAAVVQMLGEFASRIDAWVVAEGVELLTALDALIRLRVPMSQGYLLGRPLAGMAEVEHELGTHMRSRSYARLSDAGVGVLIEPAPVVRDQDGREVLSRFFAEQLPSDFVSVVDSRRRPVAVIARPGAFGAEAVHAPLTVTSASSVADVALRAMTRPPAERFVPVVCCDEAGRYLGLVRVERLVAELAG